MVSFQSHLLTKEKLHAHSYRPASLLSRFNVSSFGLFLLCAAKLLFIDGFMQEGYHFQLGKVCFTLPEVHETVPFASTGIKLQIKQKLNKYMSCTGSEIHCVVYVDHKSCSYSACISKLQCKRIQHTLINSRHQASNVASMIIYYVLIPGLPIQQ